MQIHAVDATGEDIFADMESEVRIYSRRWPAVFAKARGSHLEADDGRRFLDFFAGAGALNYGHSNPVLKDALLHYLQGDGIVHSLDMMTEAKAVLLYTLRDLLLLPRGLDYKVQFTGPTGTNAIEAALKLARKATGRTTIAAFTEGFHGVSLGALAITANADNRRAAGMGLHHTLRLPFEGFGAHEVCGLDLLEDLLGNSSSGVDLPAAVVVETVQGEGGVNVASMSWLQRLGAICRHAGILVIVDEIQAGCGRTGPFFSFEEAGLVPDIVCLSKAISGYGLPLSLMLVRREYDVWDPGEHNGTFRGNNPAFVTATAALRRYWADRQLESNTALSAEIIRSRIQRLTCNYSETIRAARGRGLLWGLEFASPDTARRVRDEAFELGLLVETSGAEDQVIKVMPPLTIAHKELEEGLELLESAVTAVAAVG